MSDVFEILQSLVGDASLTKVAASVIACRDQMLPGSIEDDVHTLHEALVHNRAQIERMQTIVAGLVLSKAKAARFMREAKALLDDAYMKAAVKPQVGFSDYATAKEKDAAFASQAVAETIEYRKAENVFRDHEAVAEFARTILRGAEGGHRDLETRIRLISLTSQLGG